MSTIVDQSEIEALLAAAKEEAAPRAAPAASGPAAASAKQAASAPSAPAFAGFENSPPQIRRLLKLRVPVRVLLASEHLPVARIRKLCAGVILEFSRNVEQPCTLMVNNHTIGHGEAVRVGDSFGLRVQAVGDAAARIRSLGE